MFTYWPAYCCVLTRGSPFIDGFVSMFFFFLQGGGNRSINVAITKRKTYTRSFDHCDTLSCSILFARRPPEPARGCPRRSTAEGEWLATTT